MFRESFKKNLIDILEKNTDLYGADFEISSSKENDNTYNLELRYIFNFKFYFNIEILVEEKEVKKTMYSVEFTEKEEITIFNCTMCPGVLFNNHQEKACDMERLTQIYSEWTLRVSEDIKATSFYGKIDRLNKEFEEFKQKIDKEDSTYFSNADAQKIIERLSELEKKISDHIEADEIEEEISRIKRDIETLSLDVYSMTKNNWFKKFFSRFSHWIGNPKNQELIVTSAKSIKNLVDSTES